MKNIQKAIFLLAFLIINVCATYGQTQQQKEITGTVKDAQGEAIIGATITIKDQPGLGTITDIDGNFKIKAGTYEILSISYLGYETTEIPVVEIKDHLQVVLNEQTQRLAEVAVTAAGIKQNKVNLTGAVTVVDVNTMRVPTSSITNALVGNVPGIIGRQTTGEPGSNNTEFWVRGISTFGANSSALVLVDGIERSLNELNVEDIESFSILKDASSTAIYGSRGANGVIIVTTKRGKSGKVNINVKAEYGYQTRSRTPKYTDGYTYATMANEAVLSRYQDPVYSEQDLISIQNGLDNDLMPNVDWSDILLKDGASNYRGTFSLSGGANVARYYVSGSYYNEQGMYRADKKLNKYDTNATYERFNYRANVDMDITKTTLLKIGVGGFLINQNKPQIDSDAIWGSLSRLTPLTVPRIYSDGRIPTYRTNSNEPQWSPETQINRAGYRTIWENKMETNVTLEQDLSFITSGLNFTGTFSFDSKNNNTISRAKTPETWYALGRLGTGELDLIKMTDESIMAQSGYSDGDKRYYTEARLSYANLFNEQHRVSGLLMYFQQEESRTGNIVYTDTRSAIPFRNMALSGRATYSFRDRYLAEFNFGYTGSENFEKGSRFGFFPAFSGAWIISEEPLVKNNFQNWLDMFKIRYSYGETGNDKLANMSDSDYYTKRFPYMSFLGTSTSYNWGELGSNFIQGYRITTMGSPNLTWEMSKKHNLGLDVVLFNNKIDLTLDYFKDSRSKIFMERNQMPYSTGLQDLRPYANLGKMENEGFDGVLAYSDKIGNVNFTLRGNITYSKTDVIDRDEAENELPYRMQKGYRLNQTRGLIALGLFKDQEDIDTSPAQTFGGTVLPGDIKYKDVNGDGIVNEDDEVPFGYTTVPGMVYGFGLSLTWKNWDMNILFQGTGKSDFFIGGSNIYPFRDGKMGNIMSNVVNPEDRWISREISGDPSTERQDALLPRLSYGGNENNYRNSTHWLRDGSYLRLKNLEFGYTIPRKIVNGLFAERARIGFIGYNMLVFSKFKWWDPEIGSSDGAKYPISKTFSVNLTIDF